jgi:chemotaxis protein MotA
VGPVAARLEIIGEAQAQFLQVLRIALVAFFRGASPILAVEYARRSIPVELRPSFQALETAIRRDARIPPIPKPGDGTPHDTQPGEISADAHPAEPAQTV